MIGYMIIFNILLEEISKEVTPYYFKINGPMADRKQEISGMDWYEDNLFLLPENLNGYVFLIKNLNLKLELTKQIPALSLHKKLNLKHLIIKETIPGFDSFEAIAFRGYEVYISIEIQFQR